MSEMPNLISATLSDEELAKALEAIDLAEMTLSCLITLTPEQRKLLPKLGQNGLGFVHQAHDLVKQRNEYMPRSFDIDEMSRDVTLLDKISTVRNRLATLNAKIADTYLALGSESYKAALVVYQNGKTNGPEDIQSVIKEMGRLFQHSTKETADAAAETVE